MEPFRDRFKTDVLINEEYAYMSVKLFLVLALALILAACSGGGEEKSDDTLANTVPTSTVSPTLQPEIEPTEIIETATPALVPTNTPSPTLTSEPTIAATNTVPPTATASPVPTDTPKPERSEETLQNAMLRLDDFPVGWTIASYEESGQEIGVCNEIRPSYAYPPVITTTVLIEKSQLGPSVFEAIQVFASNDDAKAYMDYTQQVYTCGEYTTTNDVGTVVTWRISPLNFPSLGDETFAVRRTAEGADVSREEDLVFVLQGDIVMFINYVVIAGIDSELTVQFTELAFQRMEENL